MACLVNTGNYSKLFENNYALLLDINLMKKCWPQITFEQLQDIVRVQDATNTTAPVAVATIYSIYALCPIGVVCSILCAIGFWRKGVKKGERFYVWMVLTALLDLLFCAVTVVHKLQSSFPAQAHLFQHSFEAGWIFRLFYGVYRALVISSDLTVLALSFERAVAVQRPMNPLTGRQMRMVTAIEVFLLFSMTALRFYRYTFEQEVIYNPSTGYYGSAWAPVRSTDWFQALILFNDFILVTIILVLMILCSLAIAAAVWKRRHTRIQESASSQQQLMVQKQSAAMLRLLAVVLFLYVASQVTYIAYEIAQYQAVNLAATFVEAFTYEDLRVRAYNSLFWSVSSNVSVIFSIFSRAVNFFFYYACCPTFRVEFRKAIGRPTGEVSVMVVGGVSVRHN